MSRPLYNLDWARVDELMEAGCPGTEIAAYYGMHPDTFYRHVEQHHGMGFTAYIQQKHSKGEALLREQQYKKALGKTNKGDNTNLIWLGKTRLKQREADATDISKNDKQLDSLFKGLKVHGVEPETNPELPASNETL